MEVLYLCVLLRPLFFILTEKYSFDVTSKSSQYYFPAFHWKIEVFHNDKVSVLSYFCK